METFKKEERLCNKKVIEYLFSNGSTFLYYPFKVVWLKHQKDDHYPVRILISVSKHHFKKAVLRNRLKRQIREIYRRNKCQLYDYLERTNSNCVFALIYTANDVLPYAELETKIILILQRLQMEYEKAPE